MKILRDGVEVEVADVGHETAEALAARIAAQAAKKLTVDDLADVIEIAGGAALKSALAAKKEPK